MRVRSLSHLSPRTLLDRVAELLAREREVTAELILCLAEVLRRHLYAVEGYPSMHAYCVGALGLSEDEAGRRIRVVRMARRFPQILAMIADGRLHLSGVCLLAPHLTHDNAAELLAAAARRSKRQIEQLLAERFPQEDVPALVGPIGPAAEPADPKKSVPGRIFDTPELGTLARTVTADVVEPSAPPAVEEPGADPGKSVPGRILEATPPRPRLAPLAPERYAIQFTMDQGMHDDLVRAQELLGHVIAPGEITEVLRRALRELVTKLEKARFAATSRPKPGKTPCAESSNSRHIPAAVKREVHARDEGHCTFVSETGHRCESREALEFDHVIPVAKGGKSEPGNLRLLCRAHNQYEASQALGEGFMHEIRERARASRGSQATAAAP